ncbi:site-specific integrase [uncultured Pseudoalteromonas sp.]|uniref:tyrosine-type recombinase/integrase n=1 Tax=uncultured Pseudoalteromonas sp. TaxID=114053 RepID=UPI000C45953A|nr:site-specific integrase [uncultured Pseudoalteromonas sp.]MBD55958.1 hypothetical protein [Pseudoalteromonas sp.]|tara:strand:+ start:15748 stop:16923 length:1176 start_codon:yes stop_codon:yes gene_type:complete
MAYFDIKKVPHKKKGERFKTRARIKNQAAKQKSISKTFDTLEEAKKFGELAVVKLEAQLQPKISGKVIFANFIQHDITAHSPICSLIDKFISDDQRSPNPLSTSYISALAALKGHDISTLCSGEIDWSTLTGYCRDRKSNGVSPSTIAIDISALTSCLKTLSKRYDLNLNYEVLAALRPELVSGGYISNSQVRDRRLDTYEQESIEKNLTEKSTSRKGYKYLCELFKMAIYTTLRRSELVNIKVHDVDFKRSIIRISRFKNSKRRNLAPRFIPITDDMKPILEKVIADSENPTDKVFDISSSTFYQEFKDAICKANITDLRIHDLRTEGISRYFELGLNVDQIMVFSGHKDAAVLREVYKKIDASNIATVVNFKLAQQCENINECLFQNAA